MYICMCCNAGPVAVKPKFKVGMKLEAVDQRFPYFVCVATVMDKNGRAYLLYFQLICIVYSLSVFLTPDGMGYTL